MNNNARFEWGLRVGRRDAERGANNWGLVSEMDYKDANPFIKNYFQCPEPYEGWQLAVHNTFRDRREQVEKDN